MGKIKKQGLAKGKIVSAHTNQSDRPEALTHPAFSLRYISSDYCLSNCTKEEKAAFADRIFKLSSLTWLAIQNAPKHGFGCEKIPRTAIKAAIPAHVTSDVNILALRFDGKKPMVGYRCSVGVFYIIWMDRAFTLYNH